MRISQEKPGDFVPAWLVEFAQLWTCQSATDPHYHEEYQQIKHLASAANVPPFIIALRLFRDSYQVQPDTTWDQFHARIDTQITANGDQLLLHLDVLPTEEAQRAAAAKELQDTTARAVATMEEAAVPLPTRYFIKLYEHGVTCDDGAK